MRTHPATPAPEEPLHGTRQILRFNWPAYVMAIALAIIAFLLSKISVFPTALARWVLVGAALALFWSFASIAASYWVYDRARILQCRWLVPLLDSLPQPWVNIHAGLDETTPALLSLFPARCWSVLDIYDPSRMTEPSIIRARRRGPPAHAATPARSDRLPLADGSCDAVFLIFAAHEIRQAADREQFFTEVHRVLAPRGRVVLVEHLRNAANFAAFGPGFLHFLPRREWLRLADRAALDIRAERSLTPFVRALILEKRT